MVIPLAPATKEGLQAGIIAREGARCKLNRIVLTLARTRRSAPPSGPTEHGRPRDTALRTTRSATALTAQKQRQCHSFQGLYYGADVTWLDVHPEVPDFTVNFNDVLQVILAVGGNPYPFSDPDGCCIESATEGGGGPAGPQRSTNVTLQPDTDLIAADGLVDVDVFIDGARDLAAYEVALEVSGGDAGSVVLESLTIDTKRRDYVFAAARVRQGLDRRGSRLGAATSDGRGMNVRRSSYLGTFSFRVSSDASGVFMISCAGGKGTFLTDSNLGDIAVSLGTNSLIRVAAE